jgi:hypothetical protein
LFKLTGLIIAIKIMLEFLGLNKELEPIIDDPSGNSIKKYLGTYHRSGDRFLKKFEKGDRCVCRDALL